MTTTMTLGDVVARLFDGFDDEYGDRELAALATQMIVGALLGRSAGAAPTRRGRTPPPDRTAG
jgi:hypothetical protein